MAEEKAKEQLEQTETAGAGTEEKVQGQDVLGKPEGEESKDQDVKTVSGIKKARSRSSRAFLDNLQTPQGKTISTALISVIVVVLLFFFAITPAISSITKQLKTNSNLRSRIAEQNTKLNNLSEISKKEQQYTNDLTKFSKLFSNELHQDTTYTELTNLAQKNRMEFRGLTYDPQRPKPNKYSGADTTGTSSTVVETVELDERMRFQAVKLTVNGRLSNLDNLILAIESSKRIMDIQDIVVNADETSPDLVNADISIMTVYWEVSTE